MRQKDSTGNGKEENQKKGVRVRARKAAVVCMPSVYEIRLYGVRVVACVRRGALHVTQPLENPKKTEIVF